MNRLLIRPDVLHNHVKMKVIATTITLHTCTLQKMSRTKLNVKGGEGTSHEGCLEKEEEKRGDLEEKDVKERDMGEMEQWETQRIPDKERVQETGMMRVKNSDQEASKDISQVSTILLRAVLISECLKYFQF